jgi:hypothetical protein
MKCPQSDLPLSHQDNIPLKRDLLWRMWAMVKIVLHPNSSRKRAVDSDDVFEDTPLTYDSNYDPDYLPPVSLTKIHKQ